MLSSAMGAMMERISPFSIKFLSISASTNKNIKEAIYQQMRRDFMVASPFVLHASRPDLLAGTWAIVRESLLVGHVPREQKELLATAISKANQCPFCVSAHDAAVRATGVKNASLEAWGEAINTPDRLAHTPVPFEDKDAAEFYGIVLAFQYLNRMVSAFLDDKLMPTPDFMNSLSARMAQSMMGAMVKKGAGNQPGDSAKVCPPYDSRYAWKPDWAKESTPWLAEAIAAWSALNETAAQETLGTEFVEKVGAAINNWTGGDIDIGNAWLSAATPKVESHSADLVELALTVAIAPYRVEESKLKSLISRGRKSEDLLITTAWAAYRASRRTIDWAQAKKL